jgi:glutamyl-tRNA reductase
MPVFVLGLNHISAPLKVRERLVFSVEDLQAALQDLLGQAGVEEASIISTCNRTELYTVVSEPAAAEAVHAWLARARDVESGWLGNYVYRHFDEDAIRHLLQVSAGLDSLVLGEPQILGQVKSGYIEARNAGGLGRVLGRAYQHAFAVAKQVRTDTAIGANPVSVAFAATSLAKQIFGQLSDNRALLIGAGETVELCARHLREQGIKSMVIANRTLERAEALAHQVDAKAVTLSEIPEHLPSCDIVIASTASPLPILGKGSVERALKLRKHRPMFMVDLAVPRDIEPEVEKLRDVFLYTVDDLREVIDENLRSRQEAAREAQKIIDLQVERFTQWLRAQDGLDVLRSYRRRAEQHRDEVLLRALQRVSKGEDPAAAMQYLAHTLTNRLIHAPTAGIRDAAGRGDENDLDAARRLLDIGDEEIS